MATYLTVYKITPPEVFDIRVTELYFNIDERDFLISKLKNPQDIDEFIVEVQPHKYTDSESEQRYSELNEQLEINQQLDAEGFFNDLMKDDTI